MDPTLSKWHFDDVQIIPRFHELAEIVEDALGRSEIMVSPNGRLDDDMICAFHYPTFLCLDRTDDFNFNSTRSPKSSSLGWMFDRILGVEKNALIFDTIPYRLEPRELRERNITPTQWLPTVVHQSMTNFWTWMWNSSSAKLGVLFGEEQFRKYQEAYPHRSAISLSDTLLYREKKHVFLERDERNHDLTRMTFVLYHPGQYLNLVSKWLILMECSERLFRSTNHTHAPHLDFIRGCIVNIACRFTIIPQFFTQRAERLTAYTPPRASLHLLQCKTSVIRSRPRRLGESAKVRWTSYLQTFDNRINMPASNLAEIEDPDDVHLHLFHLTELMLGLEFKAKQIIVVENIPDVLASVQSLPCGVVFTTDMHF